MFDEEVTFRNKSVQKNNLKSKSMVTNIRERVSGRENPSNYDTICLQNLTPTCHFDEKYQQHRAKSVSPFIRTPSQETLDTSHFNRSDRHRARLNTLLLEAVEQGDAVKVESLIIEGANPNATCRLGHYSACHIAALVGGDSLSILLKYGADKNRSSKFGPIPIHLAAWAGNVVQIAFLLGLPEKIQRKIEDGLPWKIIEEKIRKLQGLIKSMANVKSEIGTVTVLAKTWKDSIEHKCKELKVPFIAPSWTPLHAASCCAHHYCVRFLLAASADPNNQDIIGKTPLDVVGSAFYQGQKIDLKEEVIKILLDSGCKFYTIQRPTINYVNSPLHTAIELECLDVAEIIIDAGVSIKLLNSAGETPLHVCVRKQLTGIEMFSKYYTEDSRVAFDVMDKNGYTVLHAAVKANWLAGVYICLENGADITLQAHNGETPLHTAAELGDIDILSEILSFAKRNETVDYLNRKGETALFKAIIHGHLECVKIILKEGASVNINLPGNFNVLHIATKYGRSNILHILLNHDDVKNRCMINEQTLDHEGIGPIHMAVIYNHVGCVKLLLENNADSTLKVNKEYRPFNALTPLHMAAVKNNLEIAKIILQHNKETLHKVDSCNWTPLHAASYYGNVDVILLFISEGADITLRTKGPNNFKKTCLDLMMNNINKPTQFMEDLFDSYICVSHVPNFVTVDYRIFTSHVQEAEQMKVVETLLKTGNRFGQMRLLVHPLVESFLYSNWVYLLPFFYIMLGIYSVYVLSLNIYITSIYFYKDTGNVRPGWLNPVIWSVLIYITGTLIFTQELLYMNFGSKAYFYRLESWLKLTAITLAMILPTLVSFWPDEIWPRHVSTVTLLLSWMEMMFMLSRFPNWGYYVLMFGIVLSKVVKILLTFVFLVIGFALSFMIQFHSQTPFNDPWAAFVKTIVMMTSEFDYLDLFDDKQTKDLATSLIMIRILFLIFLILAGIVLMNLMVGVAVNDLHNLEIDGNIRRLEKQVEFLSSLEAVVYNKFLIRHLPKCLRKRRKIISHKTLSIVGYESLPLYLRDTIFHKALQRENKRENVVNNVILKNKLDEIHKLLERNRKSTSHTVRDSKCIKTKSLDRKSVDIADDNIDFDCKEAVNELKVRMELVSMEIEAINAVFRKLDNTVS